MNYVHLRLMGDGFTFWKRLRICWYLLRRGNVLIANASATHYTAHVGES